MPNKIIALALGSNRIDLIDKSELDNYLKKADVGSVLTYKGKLASESELEPLKATAATGDTYSVINTVSGKAEFFVFNGTSFDNIGGGSDVSEDRINELFDAKVIPVKTEVNNSLATTKTKMSNELNTVKSELENRVNAVENDLGNKANTTDVYTKAQVNGSFATKEELKNVSVDMTDYYNKKEIDDKFAVTVSKDNIADFVTEEFDKKNELAINSIKGTLTSINGVPGIMSNNDPTDGVVMGVAPGFVWINKATGKYFYLKDVTDWSWQEMNFNKLPTKNLVSMEVYTGTHAASINALASIFLYDDMGILYDSMAEARGTASKFEDNGLYYKLNTGQYYNVMITKGLNDNRLLKEQVAKITSVKMKGNNFDYTDNDYINEVWAKYNQGPYWTTTAGYLGVFLTHTVYYNGNVNTSKTYTLNTKKIGATEYSLRKIKFELSHPIPVSRAVLSTGQYKLPGGITNITTARNAFHQIVFLKLNFDDGTSATCAKGNANKYLYLKDATPILDACKEFKTDNTKGWMITPHNNQVAWIRRDQNPYDCAASLITVNVEGEPTYNENVWSEDEAELGKV